MKKYIFSVVIVFLFCCFSVFSSEINQVGTDQTMLQKKVVMPDRALKKIANRGDWKAWGQVLNSLKAGIPGLKVQLFDKDLTFDDLLGEAKTDGSGKFAIFYEEKDYKELTEQRPDLYIIVRNKKGKQLYSSKSQIRYGAGKDEKFDVVLKPKPVVKPAMVPGTVKK